MRILLLSNSKNPNSEPLEHAFPWIKEHFKGVKTILFVPYALKNQNQYAEKIQAAFAQVGISIISAHTSENPVELLDKVEGVYIGGGNTFRLLDKLNKTGLLKAIAEKVKNGMPYMGASAGTNVACPTIRTTNDMPITGESFNAMGLINFQINPHYLDAHPENHMGETREQRIAEFHEENSTTVVGIREGSALQIIDGKVELLGSKPARLFQQNISPVEINPGAEFPSHLGAPVATPIVADKTLRTLYPANQFPCRKEMRLVVGPAGNNENHDLYIAEYGNPNGIPVVVCHGGPGAGSSPKYAQFFNPNQYRIILFDQRGAGKSTPQYSMVNNTTQHLVEDMEKIRNLLGIEKWVVFGGSWGSTLSLVYAETHPDRVLGLILRGIWLAREDEVYGYLRADKPGPKLRSEGWNKFKDTISALHTESKLNLQTDDMIDVLYALITEGSESIKERTAIAVAKWEFTVCFLEEFPEDELDKLAKSDFGIGMALAEITYKKHRCFIEENQILANIHKIKDIKMWIVHGMYDICTPGDQAVELVNAMKNAGGQVVKFHRPIAGHTAFQPGNLDGLVKSADEFAKIFLLEKLATLNNNVSLSGSIGSMFTEAKIEEQQTAAPSVSKSDPRPF